MTGGDGGCHFLHGVGTVFLCNSEVVCGETLWGLLMFMVCLLSLHAWQCCSAPRVKPHRSFPCWC